MGNCSTISCSFYSSYIYFSLMMKCTNPLFHAKMTLNGFVRQLVSHMTLWLREFRSMVYMLTPHSMNNRVKSIFTSLSFPKTSSKIEKQANGEFLFYFYSTLVPIALGVNGMMYVDCINGFGQERMFDARGRRATKNPVKNSKLNNR